MSVRLSRFGTAELSYGDVKSRLGYRLQLPKRCCWNCACSGFPEDCCCTRMYAELMRGGDVDTTITDCGVCSGWISREVAEVYASCGSVEEARLRLAVMADDGSCVEELNNALCERRATNRMLSFSRAVETAMTTLNLDPAFPMDAVVRKESEKVEVEFTPSTAFWPVHEWLRENAHYYTDLPAHTRSGAACRSLADMMMKLDAEERGITIS